MSFSHFHISTVSRHTHPIHIHVRFSIGRNLKFSNKPKTRGIAFVKSFGAKRLPNGQLFWSLCGIGNYSATPLPILVNNQIHAQFFMHVYFYSLHVSGSHVPIIRRIIVSTRHLVCVTLCRCIPSGMQEHMLMHTRRYASTQSDTNRLSSWYNNSPDDGHMATRNM